MINELGRLPLPFGERAGVRGNGTSMSSSPPHPNPLPRGEREQTEPSLGAIDSQLSESFVSAGTLANEDFAGSPLFCLGNTNDHSKAEEPSPSMLLPPRCCSRPKDAPQS